MVYQWCNIGASTASLNQAKAKNRYTDRTHLHKIDFLFSLLTWVAMLYLFL